MSTGNPLRRTQRFSFHAPTGATIRTPNTQPKRTTNSKQSGSRPTIDQYHSTSAAQAHVNYTISQPTWLPTGFTLQYAHVLTVDNASTTSQVYANSTGTRIIVMQLPISATRHLTRPTSGANTSVNGYTATYASLGGGSMIHWTCGGFEHTIQAHLRRQPTLRIANATACTG